MGRAIAITGASGLLGGALCRAFASDGWDVRALVRRPDAEAFGESVRSFRCELPGEIDPRGLEGADVLVHCAYATRFKSLAEARRVNEEGTLALRELARGRGVGRFVFVSSLAARPDALLEYYARSKHALETALADGGGEDDLLLRPGLILSRQGAGLFHRLRDALARAPVMPLFGGGEQVCQTVHVDDLCTALRRALEGDHAGVLCVAEPEGLPFARLIDEIALRLGRRPLRLRLPYTPALWALRAVEALRLPAPISSENLLGLRGMAFVPTAPDLERLGTTCRTACESLDEILGPVR